MAERLPEDRAVGVVRGKPVAVAAPPSPAAQVSNTRTVPSVVTRSRSAVSGVTYALSGSAGSIGIGKPNADGNPTAMSVQLSPVSLER